MTASCTARDGEIVCHEIENGWRIALCVESLGKRNSAYLSLQGNLGRMSVAERIDGRDLWAAAT